MTTTTQQDHPTQPSPPTDSQLAHLREIIDHAAHLLPAQGPITVFIHHNTLHAFEDLPFDEAVQKAAKIFGCQPYLSEEHYRQDLRRGRIQFDELQAVLEEDLGSRAKEAVPCFGTRLALRLAMLEYPLLHGPTEELVWYVGEANALRKTRPEVSSAVSDRMQAETRRWVVRDLRSVADLARTGSKNSEKKLAANDSLMQLLVRFGDTSTEIWSDSQWESFTLQALWRVCCDGVRDVPQFTVPPSPSIRHRDLLFEATGLDADTKVNEILIRFCASFLDQGLSHWQLPRRKEGFLRSFLGLYGQPRGPRARWLRGLPEELGRIEEAKIEPLESIRESLEILGVPESEWSEYISAALLALRGWAGMIRQVEIRGDRVVQPIPSGSLVEFLAVRLILDRFALEKTARNAFDFSGPLAKLRDEAKARLKPTWPPSVEQRAFLIFQLAQLFGLSPEALHRLRADEWSRLVEEAESFTGVERRRIFQLAYEKRFTTQTLDAIALRAKTKRGRPNSPAFQVICCIDEREESFRRHLEEVAPQVETFGVAGFFAVAIYYRGAADAHFVPLCPGVIVPGHWVVEEPDDQPNKVQRVRATGRRVLGTASLQFHQGSRSFAVGALLTGVVGVLASFPLIARILFPRVAARIRRAFGGIVRSSPETHLRLERTLHPPGAIGGEFGFTVAEMTDISERLLRDIGLIQGFARLVILVGHGSHSQNNPHASAYNCGACGGSSGGPNARAVAEMLSDTRVRAGLAGRGLVIADEVLFLGACHDTCADSVILYDLERVPETHHAEFARARQALEHTSERNAHERCRRFMSAALTLTYREALHHVENRAEDLAQNRPEIGHATNAITIVGRREWSRGLYLDRRAFLAAYDPTQDDAESSILTRILAAVFPVCAGINLEYYFSFVDSKGFGCGSKLPHNIVSLLGVMDGASSDLRTGLPWQMVEIHEPVRSLFVIETTPEAMLGIMDKNPGIGQICRNRWVQLAVLHPVKREIFVLEGGEFRPYETQSSTTPKASSSVDWYRGWRDHLEFAEIEALNP